MKKDKKQYKAEQRRRFAELELIKEPITYGCDGCEQIAMSMNNPCQCLSCDPDGTRYICTCDENNKGENNELSSNKIR